MDDAIWIPGRVRTAKEARELLEELRSCYRSLAPEQRREVKNYMSHLSKHQRRFGSIAPASEGSFSERIVNG